MHKDTGRWQAIRRKVREGECSIHGAAREFGISRNTVRKILAHPAPLPYRRLAGSSPKLRPHMGAIRTMLEAETGCSSSPTAASIFERLRLEEGYSGSYSTVWRCVRSLRAEELQIEIEVRNHRTASLTGGNGPYPHAYKLRSEHRVIRQDEVSSAGLAPRKISVTLRLDAKAERRRAAFAWMQAASVGDIDLHTAGPAVSSLRDLDALIARMKRGSPRDRASTMAVIARAKGISAREVGAFVGVCPRTVRKRCTVHAAGGASALYSRRPRASRKVADETLKDAIFALFHEPPSLHGINRTSWIMPELSRVLATKGHSAGLHTIRAIVKAAGYRWRKARVVLTSQDPDYVMKLEAVQAILSGLSADEAFFSIDEFGPFSIRMRQGVMLEEPGPHRVVPQHQRSKGSLIMTAALELSANQITHFYSRKKNTEEMIRLMGVLLERYPDRRRLYLSWDAASWHMSKKLTQAIESHNAAAAIDGSPLVAAAPLPAGAQFLNVIESVFSGMARAIIHNSDYASVEAATEAIDRYVADRNARFQAHPQRAGRKIWGKEREPATFSAANNCKDPNFR